MNIDANTARHDAYILSRAREILERTMQQGVLLTDPAAAGSYIQLRLKDLHREVFVVLFLDCRNRLLAYEEMFMGTVDGAEVHPREVVKAALRYNASAVILGHNHPSGDTHPSAADRVVTERVKASLKLVDVRILDHFVVGAGPPVSMAKLGWV